MAFYQYKIQVRRGDAKVMDTKYYETYAMASKWLPVYQNKYYPKWDVRLYKLKTEPVWEEVEED